MHAYRTHKCNELGKGDVGKQVKLSGWVHRKRDHGGVLFIDLRDTHGITQLVSENNAELERVRVESVITVQGEVKARTDSTINPKMKTGEIEVYVSHAIIQSQADVLPFQVAEDDGAGEEVRLKYRFLDLRREGMHSRVRLRNNVISAMRRRMWDQGFQEFNTPILTASSPEGARDYLVPSRLHPGKFYALPQAPQQFKQLLMVGGFDRYFQIAPCFRDEDGRADRLAEFYQLDVEMSFVTQEEVFATMSPVVGGIFEEFNDWTGTDHKVVWSSNMTYSDAMTYFGSDKPDIRNPLMIADVTRVFEHEDVEFKAFRGVIEKGGRVLAVKAPGVGGQPRSFFDKLNDWARGEGAPGLGYILFENGEGKGPIAKFVPEAMPRFKNALENNFANISSDVTSMGFTNFPKELTDNARNQFTLNDGDALFFICDMREKAHKFAGRARDKICDDMGIREKGVYKLFWVVDFPMYEVDEKTGKIDFSHNPFSMPQGGLEALNGDPLKVLANQYDCVCNGFELASGGIRNHRPDIMEKAFAIAGYDRDVLEKKFGGMLNAFKYGAPPHGGCAFGVDRIVMLLANEPNLREVYAFVMNGQYEDPMMAAPSAISEQQLKDLHLKVNLPKKVEAA